MIIPTNKDAQKIYFGGILAVCLGIAAFACGGVVDMPIAARYFILVILGTTLVIGGLIMIRCSLIEFRDELQDEPPLPETNPPQSSESEPANGEAGTESSLTLNAATGSNVPVVENEGPNDVPAVEGNDASGGVTQGDTVAVGNVQVSNGVPVAETQACNEEPVNKAEASDPDAQENASNGGTKK